jgi:hypothetical protein
MEHQLPKRGSAAAKSLTKLKSKPLGINGSTTLSSARSNERKKGGNESYHI